MRPFSTVLMACALGLSVLANDAALGQTCVALQSELDHLRGSGAGSSRDRSRFERAFREQANVLARTEARARNAGCFGGSGFFFGRQAERACGVLIPKLRDMQNNLARLDRLRRQAGDDASPRRIRQLQRAIAARGCGLPGEDMWERPAEARRTLELEPVAPFSTRGTFRTLCVRTCDGYYFPISFSTTQEQFGADAQTCSAMCPGAQARLFYHANPGGSPADMLSIDGATYTSLPTAFQYRTSLNPSCSCKPAGGYSPIPVRAEAQSSPAQTRAGPGPLLPRARPGPGEDPETLANRSGGFNPKSVTRDAGAPTAALTADGRPVRVVGPAYWGAPERDGVVVTPVPN